MRHVHTCRYIDRLTEMQDDDVNDASDESDKQFKVKNDHGQKTNFTGS